MFWVAFGETPSPAHRADEGVMPGAARGIVFSFCSGGCVSAAEFFVFR